MTNYQWKVLIALVRIVLNMKNIDLDNSYDEQQNSIDESILIEAVQRNEKNDNN